MPATCRIAQQRHHVVAVAAEDAGRHVFERDLEFFREEMPEAGRIEDAGHADHFSCGNPGRFLQRPNHGIERIGDADHEGIGRIKSYPVADRLHDLEIDAEQIIAAHAGLARHARGDDHHIGAGDRRVIIGAVEMRMKALLRRRLREVQGFALRYAFGNVEEDDVAQFLERGDMGERAADLAGADQRDLPTWHNVLSTEPIDMP